MTAFSREGYNSTIQHEFRRRGVYTRASRAFLELAETTGKEATKCGWICRKSDTDSQKALSDYLDNLRSKAKTDYKSYVIDEQLAIGRETYDYGFENWGLDYKILVIRKFTSIHTINNPVTNWNAPCSEKMKQLSNSIIFFFFTFFCMASDSPENPQYQLILHQSDLSELSPQMQKLLSKDKETRTGFIVEHKGDFKDDLKRKFICFTYTGHRKTMFNKTNLNYKEIKRLLDSKKNSTDYFELFGHFGERPSYAGDVLRHTWNLALMKDEKEVSELIIVEGYFKPNGKVNGKMNFKLLGFRIFSSNHADVTN